MNKVLLIVLQVIGAMSLLPYPFVLLANVMSLAAPGQTLFGAIPFLLLTIYPVIWIALWIFSWWAISRGEVAIAYVLSSVPLLFCMGAFGLYLYGWKSVSTFDTKASDDVRRKIEPVNPLLWTIWCSGSAHHFPPGPTASPQLTLQEIAAHPTLVNVAVPGYGTPLKMAVENLSIGIDGSPVKIAGDQEPMLEIVRSLVAHGAHFAPDEIYSVKDQWRLRLSAWKGPITTETENPLVWRILTRTRDGMHMFKLQDDERPWLNISTRLHGTPLYAALLEDAPDLFPELIRAGAKLSAEESQDPAASAALAKLLDFDLELKRDYAKP